MKVIETFDVRPVTGEVGVEVEVETDRDNTFPAEVAYWNAVGDGSLRGNAVEYVLRKPSERGAALRKHLDKLAHCLRKVPVLDTGRAGTHIHINMQTSELEDVITTLCIYFTFERSLLRFCGPAREGNLFCLSANDAEYLVRILCDTIRSGRWGNLSTDEVRYAGVNVKALATYGSLEFRGMRSTVDPDLLEDWANTLLALKDAGQNLYENPQDFIAKFSEEGPDATFLQIFGEDTPLQYDYMEAMQGVRLAQLIAYTPLKKREQRQPPRRRRIPPPAPDDYREAKEIWLSIVDTRRLPRSEGNMALDSGGPYDNYPGHRRAGTS